METDTSKRDLVDLETIPVARGVSRLGMHMSRKRAFFELVLVVLAFPIGLVVSALVITLAGYRDANWMELVTSLAGGISAALTAICLTKLNNHPLASIGWRIGSLPADSALAIGALFATYLVMIPAMLALMLLYPELIEERKEAVRTLQSAIPATSIWAIILILTCVVFWEEVVFRGFLLTRLKVLFKRWWLAVPVSAILFGLGHGYQGPVALVLITFLGVVMALLVIWRQSLTSAMIYHFTFNFISMMALRSINLESA